METIKTVASLEDVMFNDNYTEVPVEPTPPVDTQESTDQIDPIEPPVDTTEPPTDPVDPPVETTETVEEPTNVEITTIEEPQVKEIIKEVEKPITFKDEQSEKIYKALTEGGEDAEKQLYEYLNKKYTDYGTMSDIEVLRRKIQSEKPHWDNSDIEYEIESRYGGENLQKYDLSLLDKELDADLYKQQEDWNKQVDKLNRLKERDAKDARLFLDSQKPSNVELPNVQRGVAGEPQPTQQEIEEQTRQWHSRVDEEMNGFEALKFKVGNEEIAYKLTEEERGSQKDYIKKTDLPTLLRDLGWVGENGEDNILKLAEDVHFLRNRAKIISSIGTQMKTAAKKEVLAKDIKNIDLEPKTTTVDAPKQSFADLALGL